MSSAKWMMSLYMGSSQEDHDRNLVAALQRIADSKMTLNYDKCLFSKKQVPFLGSVIGAEGIVPQPEKLRAITEMAEPNSVTEVRRFLGMANQLGKYSPRLAETTKPLRDLLSKENQWVWGDAQMRAFKAVKELLTADIVLALYDPHKETTVAADASSYGLGAVVLQRQDDGQDRPVAFASRAISETE